MRTPGEIRKLLRPSWNLRGSDDVGLPAATKPIYGQFLSGCALWRSGILLAVLGFWLAGSALAQTVTFDFDTATPALMTGQNVPFDQTTGGVTAHFSAASGGFSVQNYNTTFQTHSLFLDNYLSFNVQFSVLDILFNQQVTNISLAFVIGEATPVENPTPIGLTAYLDSAANPAVGTTNATGTYIGGEGQPSGTLTFSANGQPFNLVRLALQTGGVALGFMVDNITVQTSGLPAVPSLQSSGSAGGPFADDSTATVDGAQRTITVPMKPANQFYRLRSNASTRIVQIQAVGGQVILRYESL